MPIRTRPDLPHAFAADPASTWEEDLFSVFNGGLSKARVGRIPRILAKAIGSSTTIVYFSKTTAKKIRGKHSEVTFADLRALNTVFQSGNVAREGQLHLSFWYPSPSAKNRTIKAVIKGSNHGTEIYLKSIYPIAKRRLKAMKAKVMILRQQSDEA